jgi:hypothetical protein
MGVCLNHVVNGLLIFVPRMIKAYANKTEFHVVTTSSMGAFMAVRERGPYSAAKRREQPDGLVCRGPEALRRGRHGPVPGNINSNIGNAEKYRPET